MPGSADTIFYARSEGISAEGVRDQYADGKAAQVWEIYIGDKSSRTDNYKHFLVNLLRQKGCKRILDAACGTGVDSILLLEEGFDVISVDASDKMLKYALAKRWERRKEPAFDKWIVKEANWLSLYEDLADEVGEGFDAVLCLGNSFANLLDSYGDQREHYQAIRNFEKCVKPGGILLIDHRNNEQILSTGHLPVKNIYYNTQHTVDIKTYVMFNCGKPYMITYDYVIEADDMKSEFRISNFPHKLKQFTSMLTDAFGPKSKHQIYGDFKEISDIENPNFYIHVIEKAK